MALQTLPHVARDYSRQQRRETGAAIAAAGRLWARVGDDFEAGFASIAPQLIEVMNTTQLRVSRNAQTFIPEILDATDQTAADRPRHTIAETVFVGTAGDGRPTEALAREAVIKAKTSVANGATVRQAHRAGGEFLSLALGTLFADTRRGMESFETYTRPVSGWVRQLTPPSCGRCVILAGRRYKKSQGFARHPGCDCIHIPAAENIAGSLTTNTGEYLGSLNDKQLAKALGSKANARAYTTFGADPWQIVNSQRNGIRKAQLFGRSVKYTTEGTTVRGVAYLQMSRVTRLAEVAKQPGRRYRALTQPRLMPETIIGFGLNQQKTEQLLREYGWLGLR